VRLEAEADSFTVALPGSMQPWLAAQADKMGLPSPDSYVLLLLRLEKQRQELSGFHGRCGEGR